MSTFFSLLYLKPNKHSDEKISIGIIGSLDGVPFFHLNEKKLSFGLKMIDKSLHAFIRKSLRLLSFDVNKYREGRESLPLFDEVVSSRFLKEMARNKRGKIVYGDPLEFEKAIKLEELVKKYIGKDLGKAPKVQKTNPIFKSIKSNKLRKFEVRKTLAESEFPELISNAKIDLLRHDSSFTSFHFVDLTKKGTSLRTDITRYISTINALVEHAISNSMGKGRHYLVYDKSVAKGKKALLDKIKKKAQQKFELIPLNEINDKV